jgi:hypothetical protein
MPWSSMVSLELSDDDKIDTACPPALADVPDYPWGMRITLTHRELEKIGKEADCRPGDMLEFRAVARVIGVYRNDGPMGPEDRVELQIEQMAVETDE